jgi:amino acid adenylation domain-containing protein
MLGSDNRSGQTAIADDPAAWTRLSGSEFLTQLTALGIEVRARDGKLQLTAPQGALTATLQAELRRRKPDLLNLLAAHEAEGEERVAPLTFAQQRLWLIDRFSPNGTAYNIPQSWAVDAAIDHDILRQALDHLAQRHQVFRTRFLMRDGEAVQVVLKQVTIPLEFTDLSTVSDLVEQEAKLNALLIYDGQQYFSLDQAPLIRFHLIRLATERYVVAYNMHHIISDQWSLGVLKGDLTAMYLEAAGMQTAALPTLVLQYADMAARERSEATTRLYDRQLAYWRERLQGMPTLLELPFSKSRPAEQTFLGKTLATTIDAELTVQLRRLAARTNISLYLLMLNVFTVLLYRYTGTQDICVGTPITGRKTHDDEYLIGLFVNMLPLRTIVDPAESFNDLLKRAGNAALNDFEHSDLPFQKLVTEMHPYRSPSYSPLFQIMFALNAKGTGDHEDQKETYIGVSKFDLTVQIVEHTDTLVANFEYRTDLFEEADILQFSRHLVSLSRSVSRSVSEQPGVAVGKLALLTPEDDALFQRWNTTGLSFDRSHTLISLFEEQVRIHPDAPALYVSHQMHTFSELAAKVDQLAASLVACGAAGGFVALCQSRTLELIVSMLAVLKAGAAYLPLDPKYPEERLAYMLADSGSTLMIAERSELSERLAGANKAVTALFASEELASSSQHHRDDAFGKAKPEDAAYLIYTSGSTGKPKGVLVEHQNAVSLLAWARHFFDAQSIRGMLASTSVCFDLSIFEIFLPLTTGNAIVLVQDVLELGAALHADKVTLVNTVPSAMNALLQAGLPRTVRTVCMAGEFLPSELVDRVYSAGVEQVFDLYGPTETTTYSTCALRASGTAPTIGKPIANTRIYLLDDQLMQVAPGATGEIVIGGEGVTRGYLHKAELTDERYLTLPMIEPHGRLYRTGDLARYLPDGSLAYQGRRDNQIKLRGHRIELGEIEEALREASGVSQLAVVVQKREAGDVLVAFITAGANAPVDTTACTAALRKRLPAYMIPAHLVLVNEMPLTPNGKIDRKVLSVPVKAAASSAAEMPHDLLEQWLANIWSDRLGQKQIARDAHFFDDLGGHSLVAFEIFAQIEKRIGVAMMLATLFQAPTVELLASAVRRSRWQVPKHLSLLASGTSDVVLYCVGLTTDIETDEACNLWRRANPTARMMLLAPAQTQGDIDSCVREMTVYEAARPLLALAARTDARETAEKLVSGLSHAGFAEASIHWVS